MKLVKKISILLTGAIVAMLLVVMAYKASNAQISHQKASANTSMYTKLKRTGKYKSVRGDLTVLTDEGKDLLNPNLTFEGNRKKPKKEIGFNFKKSYVTKGATEGEMLIPRNLKSGDIIQTKLPFPTDLLTGNTKLKLFLDDRVLIYNRSSLQRIGENKDSKLVGVMVGYNFHEGKRIPDEEYLAKYEGKKVKYRFEGELYTPTKTKKKFRSAFLKKPAIIFNNVDYKLNDNLYSFEVVTYKKAPKIYNLTAKLDGKDVKDKLDVQIKEIKDYSNSMRRYQIVANAKEPLQGKKLEISTTILGTVSFQAYSSNSILSAI